jgi:hypothetical protein
VTNPDPTNGGGRGASNGADADLLHKLTTLANHCAFIDQGQRNTCVATSHALHHVLTKLGYSAKLCRVTCKVFPGDRNIIGTVLGAEPLGERLPASAPGMWKGHLVVTVNDEWLLDPTLDQANKRQWPASIRVRPAVVPIPSEFWVVRTSGRTPATIRFGTTPPRTVLNTPEMHAHHIGFRLLS